MKALGAEQESIDEAEAILHAFERPFEVLEELADDLRLFISLSSQWRWASEGFSVSAGGASGFQLRATRKGLDYASIQPTARMLGIKMTPQRFDHIQRMEIAALDEFTAISREQAGQR